MAVTYDKRVRPLLILSSRGRCNRLVLLGNHEIRPPAVGELTFMSAGASSRTNGRWLHSTGTRHRAWRERSITLAPVFTRSNDPEGLANITGFVDAGIG